MHITRCRPRARRTSANALCPHEPVAWRRCCRRRRRAELGGARRPRQIRRDRGPAFRARTLFRHRRPDRGSDLSCLEAAASTADAEAEHPLRRAACGLPSGLFHLVQSCAGAVRLVDQLPLVRAPDPARKPVLPAPQRLAGLCRCGPGLSGHFGPHPRRRSHELRFECARQLSDGLLRGPALGALFQSETPLPP